MSIVDIGEGQPVLDLERRGCSSVAGSHLCDLLSGRYPGQESWVCRAVGRDVALVQRNRTASGLSIVMR